MIYKYLIYSNDDRVVALRFDEETSQLSVGGYNRDADIQEQILTEVFGRNRIPTPRQVQRNKRWYTIRSGFREFMNGVKELRETAGIVVENTRSFGRLVR